jgi:hypothetical protein
VNAASQRTDGVAPDDFAYSALGAGLQSALSRLSRAQGDRDAIEIHDLKSRRARRVSCFIGRCTPSRFGMIVHWGIVLKRSSPRRAAELRALYGALQRALGPGNELPAAPRIVCAPVRDGWIALKAWPGFTMASDPHPVRRAQRAARVARLLASLEGSLRAGQLWPRRYWTVADEMRRLEEVWARAGHPLPRWAPELAAELARFGTAPVPAHRDLYPEQVIVDALAEDTEASARRWIDWDQAALASPGLDLGNLLAHERLEAVLGNVATVTFQRLRSGVLTGYREAGGRATDPELAAWEAVACLRLAGLSLQRARGDDPVTRNPAWLSAPSTRRAEAEVMRRAAKEVFLGGVRAHGILDLRSGLRG